jgi:hypothetical protein
MKRNEISLEDFKKWMEARPSSHSIDRPGSELTGTLVETKVSMKKFASKMVMETGDIDKVVAEFKESGGKIIDVEDKNFLIETTSGSFVIHKYYVRRKSIEEES